MAVRADWVEKDLYAVLGVAQDADSKAVTRAYRQLARDLHPDTHPDDPEAAERFKEVTAAYDVIGDADKRAEYDEFRRAVTAGGGQTDYRGGGFDGGGFDGDDGQRFTWFSSGDTGSAWFEDGELDGLLGGLFGRAGADGADRPRRGADLEAEVFDLVTKWIERYRQEAEERYARLDAVLAEMRGDEQHLNNQRLEQGAAS